MKLNNPSQQVSYGVANGASFWRQQESRDINKRYRKCASFWPFKNERQAHAAAKRITGARVVRRVVATMYAYDE